jgi:DNA repair exonuclease SbcCD ATPase subunit
MADKKEDTGAVTAATSGAQTPRRSASSDRQLTDASGGIEHIREILFGDIVVEIERRLARLDHLITHRNSELQHDVQNRTDVLEAHVRKELETLGARAAHDNSETSASIRALKSEHRNELAQFEQRLARIEDRIETSIARVEREARDQLLAQAKTFIDELERVRSQLRAALASELGLAADTLEQEGEHAEPRRAPH